MKFSRLWLRFLFLVSLLAACAPTPLSADQIPGAIAPTVSIALQAQRLAWLQDNSAILVGSGTVLIWLDPVTLAEQTRLDLGNPIEGLLVSPDGTQLLVLHDPVLATVVDLSSREIRLQASSWRENLTFCPAGQSLDVLNFQNAYCATDDFKLMVKAANKKWQKAIRGGGTMERISPDGRTWALGLGGISEATSWLIDLKSKELTYKLVVGGGDVVSVNGALALAFSPDSSQFAMADLAGLITLWNPANGEQLETLAAGELGIDLVFSPDGRSIAMTGEEHVLIFQLQE